MQVPLSQSLSALLFKALSLLLKLGRRFLSVIVRRLFSLWKYCAGSIRFLPENGKMARRTPRSPPRTQSMERETVERSHLEQEAHIVKDLSYSVIEYGESLSLEEVARSEYPFSGGSIRNVSQASLSLQGSRQAHERNVGGSRPQTRHSQSRSAYSPSSYSLSSQSITFDVDNTDHRPSLLCAPTRSSLASVSRTSLNVPDTDFGYLGVDHPRKSRTSFITPMPTVAADDITELPRIPSHEPVQPSIAAPLSTSIEPGVENTPQSSSPQCLARKHISPAIPGATQRYAKRPLM